MGPDGEHRRMRTLLTLVLVVAAFARAGACVADSHRCAAGTHWDATKMRCVPDRGK